MNKEFVLNFFFLFFFLFSNVLSRMIDPLFNTMLYVIIGLNLIYYFSHRERYNVILNNFTNFIITVFLIFVLDPRYYFVANLSSIKDFIVPFLAFFVGKMAYNNNKKILNTLNYFFFVFSLYGVLQQVTFYTFTISTYFPWDWNYILKSKEIIGNFFQGNLVRFFGTMNAFVEYQVTISFLGMFLFANKNLINNKQVLKLSLGFMLLFLILSFERSPIAMLIIFSLVWKRGKFFQKINYRYILIVIFVSVVLFIYTDIQNVSKIGMERLENVFTLNFSRDEAIQVRVQENWKEAFDLATVNPFGIAPGRVSPGAYMLKEYVGPHNNLLGYYLAYGFFGFFLVVFYFISIIKFFNKGDGDSKNFIQGLFISFLSMAFFNMPFIGKQGIVFFFLIGWYISKSYLLQKKSRIIK